MRPMVDRHGHLRPIAGLLLALLVSLTLWVMLIAVIAAVLR